MPSADQVPVKSTHSMMLWPSGLSRSPDRPALHYVLFALPTVTSTPESPARSRLRRECGGFLVAFVPGHHRPGHPGEFIGERDGGNLGGSPRQQRGEPRPMPSAMDLGIADHGERAGREQAAQIAIALLADTAKLVLAPTRVLLRNEPNPRREVPSGSENLWIGNARDKRCGQCRTDARDRIQPLARRVCSMPGHDPPVELQYLSLECSQLTAERSKTRTGHFWQPAVGCIGDDLQQLLDTPAPDRGDDPELGKIGAD